MSEFQKLNGQTVAMEVPNGVVIAAILGTSVSTVFVPGLRIEVTGSSEIVGIAQVELKAPCRMDYDWKPQVSVNQPSTLTPHLDPTSYLDE